jgi:hypothetical protein
MILEETQGHGPAGLKSWLCRHLWERRPVPKGVAPYLAESHNVPALPMAIRALVVNPFVITAADAYRVPAVSVAGIALDPQPVGDEPLQAMREPLVVPVNWDHGLALPGS